ncbi:MAG: hypothetical protein RBT33_02285 [Candidatus Dojkabacteria bacterium]|jgi:hypothetical protein|nr:hypothetical protein [Candidatus Dojkabacteria bacterium]
MHIKQKNTLYKTFLLIFTLLLFPITVLATELDSPNYKIVGVTTQGGGIIESTSGNYSALLNVGSISANPRLYSTSYGLSTSPETPFLPAIPTISCFETDTNGSSACTTGPAALTTGGMVAICGPSGCYNKARFEVSDTSASNPADTLYAVMISTDNFVSDIRYIDASTFMPESYSTHNINDFMTKADWEAETFNIKGLDSNTTYYIKAFALKGDFTQTATGPIKSATTASGSVFFDIDIAGSTGYTAETSAPYSIAFTGAYELIGGAAAITAGNRIWMDVQTNSDGGFAIVMSGVNGGLRSPTTTQTITSANANLDQVASGFGLQSEYIDYDSSSSLFGEISATTDYSGTINTVGIVSPTAQKIYDGDGPIVDGRMALKVIAKPGITYTPATDYQETIYLIFVPRY